MWRVESEVYEVEHHYIFTILILSWFMLQWEIKLPFWWARFGLDLCRRRDKRLLFVTLAAGHFLPFPLSSSFPILALAFLLCFDSVLDLGLSLHWEGRLLVQSNSGELCSVADEDCWIQVLVLRFRNLIAPWIGPLGKSLLGRIEELQLWWIIGRGDRRAAVDNTCLGTQIRVAGLGGRATSASGVVGLVTSMGEMGPTPLDSSSQFEWTKIGEDDRYGVDVDENIGSWGDCRFMMWLMSYCTPERL